MKFTFILFLSLLWSVSNFAQDNNPIIPPSSEKYGKHEIGLNCFSMKFYNDKWIKSYAPNNFFGIMYKRHFNESAIRIGIDYYRETDSYFWDEGGYWWKNKWKENAENLHIGYERSFFKGKVKPFIAADLYFAYSQTNGTSEGFGGDFLPPEYYKNYYVERVIQVGITPFFGLKYKPTQRLSFSIETNFAFLYYYWDTWNDKIFNNDFRIELFHKYYPIRLLSINYEFGKK